MIANQRALLLLTLLSIFSGNNLQNALIYIIIYIFKTRVLNINYDQIPNSNRERKKLFSIYRHSKFVSKMFFS